MFYVMQQSRTYQFQKWWGKSYMYSMHPVWKLHGQHASNVKVTWTTCIQCESYMDSMHPVWKLHGQHASSVKVTWTACIQCESYMDSMHPMWKLHGQHASNVKVTWTACIQCESYMDSMHPMWKLRCKRKCRNWGFRHVVVEREPPPPPIFRDVLRRRLKFGYRRFETIGPIFMGRVQAERWVTSDERMSQN